MKTIPRALTFDTCARINALIKHANVTVLARVPGTMRSARVTAIQPSENKGYLLVQCHDIVGGMIEVEQGIDVPFSLIVEH